METCDFVYVCSPLSAPTPEGVRKNMQKASGYTDLIRMNLGCRAIAPQSFLPDYLDNNIPVEREAGMKIRLCLLQMSKAVVVCGDTVTEGMKGPKTAKLIVAKYGTKTFDILDKYPDSLLSIKGITEKNWKLF